MYAPIGYHTFGYLLSVADHLAGQVWLAKRRLEANQARRGKEASAERTLLTAWIISRSLHTFPTAICSPQGHALRVDPLFCFHEDQLDWYEWGWPIEDHDELSGPYHRMVKEDLHPFDRFRFIDVITGTICVQGRIDAIKNAAKDADEYIDIQLDIAKRFDGWAVCFSEDEFPLTEQEFFEKIGLLDEIYVSGQQSTSLSIGRPRLQEIAKEAYQAIYPAGHGGEPWKIVETRVAEVAGRPISYKTIKRAIGQRSDN